MGKHNKPVTTSLEKWARNVALDGKKLALLEHMLDGLDPEDVRAIGYDPETLLEPLERVDIPAAQLKAAEQASKDKWDRYKLQRRTLVHLRRGVHHNFLGTLLKKLRFYADLILRGDGGAFSRYAHRPYGSDEPIEGDFPE